jgi:hypothetical protein
LIFDELAAVTEPFLSNAGLSVGILSSGAANGSSSASMRTGGPFFCGTSTEMISSARAPLFVASCARRYDSSAKASCSSRVKEYFDTHISAHEPMCLSP